MDFTEKPGAIPWLDGQLMIERKHIANWVENPTAVYETSLGGSFGGVKTYILGSWEPQL